MKYALHHTKYVLLLIILLILCNRYAFSEDLISSADSFFAQGKYNEAITEYKRFIFFNANSDEADSVFFKIGLAYRKIRNWHYALDAIENSVNMAKSPAIADERRLSLATTLIASKDYNFAKLELINLIDSTKSEQTLMKALYFSGVASVYNNDWDSTSKYFGDFYNKSNSENRLIELNSILPKTKRSYKSPRIAKILSVFLPGSGQIYSGNWRDGLNAFLLNGLLIGSNINAIYKKDYDNAILIFALLTSRYYMGNIYHAEKDAEKYNETLDRNTADKILNLISSDEP